RVALAAASTAQAAVSFISFGLPAIGPQLRHAYGLSLAELGAVPTANLLGAGVALIGAGVVVDRLGSRRAMLAGTTLAAAGLVGAAESRSGSLLFAGLLVSGVGTAVVPVAGAGALFRFYPAARRGWALGVRQMAVPLGGTVSAATLPGLGLVGGVRLALLVGAGLICASGVAFALVLGNERLPAVRSERAFRSILGAAGMQRLLVVGCCYVVVLQALVSYAVPAVRAAGFSRFWASATYVGVNVAAMVSRIVWGRVADRAAGGRRIRTLVETGAVAAAERLDRSKCQRGRNRADPQRDHRGSARAGPAAEGGRARARARDQPHAGARGVADAAGRGPRRRDAQSRRHGPRPRRERP